MFLSSLSLPSLWYFLMFSARACVQAVLDVLCDPTCLLGMAALVPFIESLDSVITFSWKRDVFICDLIDAVKVCEGQLYSMYNCHSRALTIDEFFVVKSIIEGTHDHIHTRWVLKDSESATMFNLNFDVEHLAFVVNGNNLYAKHRNEKTSRMKPSLTRHLQQLWRM